MEIVDILIQHGILLTLNKDRQIITDGAVAVRKDRIVAVGKTANLREKFRAKKTIDASMRVVMPGWPCALARRRLGRGGWPLRLPHRQCRPPLPCQRSRPV